MRLKVAARKSDLARWQAVLVARALERLPQKPQIEFNFKSSLGDLDQETPLAVMRDKGVFTEDFHRDLVAGRCDLVVHSWKDLPLDARTATRLAMTLPRADVRDLFLLTEKAWQEAVKRKKLAVLTSSPRRVYNLGSCLSDLLPRLPNGEKLIVEFVNVRGNVPTRLRKMREQNSALVLAKAGLDRLLQAESQNFFAGEQAVQVRSVIHDCRFMVLPISLNPGAPAQGALAVEIMANNSLLNTICAEFNDPETFACVETERAILQRYGGGCHQKIGVTILQRPYGQVTSLRGLTDQGEVLCQWTVDHPSHKDPWPRALDAREVFPLEARANNWFERRPLTVDSSILAAKPALFVARAEALLGVDYIPLPTQLIWTAGMQTWNRLAAQGIWVHGTADGLGEQEQPELEALLGKEVTWTKLTHRDGNRAPNGELLPTYQLTPASNPPDLRGKTHFFWLSSSSFDRARQLFPREVSQGFNASGPGSTFEHIQAQTGLLHPVKVFIGRESFLSASLPQRGDE